MLVVDHVKKTYVSGDRTVEAVADLHFQVEDGEFACIVGPSGSGKTTLLKTIAGLLEVTSGSITLDGNRVSGPPMGLALVFQEYGRSLFPWKRVAENVELPLKQARVPKRERAERVNQALHSVGLEGSEGAYPWQLSGGMQQRVAIARAIAFQPSFLLMDEPFAAVDAQTRADLEDLVLKIWRESGITTLFVTHDVDEAVYLGQRVIVLSSSPTIVQRTMEIDLPADRNQEETKALPRFAELRRELYHEIQVAKQNKGLIKS